MIPKNALGLGDYADYFEYLCDLVGGEDWVAEYGWDALTRLFERAYYWSNPVDGSMLIHVETLRAEALPRIIPNTDPSIFEILVVLARRIDESIMYDWRIEPGKRVPSFFHNLMEALGFYGENIDEAIDAFLDGENLIAEGNSLWEQCNQLYYERFNIENEEA